MAVYGAYIIGESSIRYTTKVTAYCMQSNVSPRILHKISNYTL